MFEKGTTLKLTPHINVTYLNFIIKQVVMF